MKNRLLRAVTSVAVAAACLTSAHASYIDAPLPSNSYIVRGLLDWAWAFPLPAASGLDLSFESSQGWRLPTLAELASAPLATDFMFAGANVPLGGTDPVSGASFSAVNATLNGAAACATPYFSNSFRHCDWQDGNGQLFQPWAGTPGEQSFADQLVVRADTAAAVPEPATLALLSLGLLGMASVSRRKDGKK